MSTCVATSVDIALLGCGNVGTALARLALRDSPHAPALNITGALVRDPARPRRAASLPPLTADAGKLLADRPGVVVELLGGVEPARAWVVEALARHIPVVTANKTLLASHGAELRTVARATRTPLLYEAAVLAGVPFLGTFARRPHAAAASSLAGITNGTSNFILTRCAAGSSFPAALAEARRLGYAEPDPRSDVAGRDAAEKLVVLLQHFAGRDVAPEAIETEGIDRITPVQSRHAQELGGVIKPVVAADWTRGLEAFVGPAFVPSSHALARVDGVENALLLNGARGRLLFQGPGAGPEVTAATVLDDVREIAAGAASVPEGDLAWDRPAPPVTGWMVTLDAARLPRPADIADLLASHGIFAHRVTARECHGGREFQSLRVWPVSRAELDSGLQALGRGARCSTTALRALEEIQ